MTSRPLVTSTRSELADALKNLAGSRALVMTMGALHDGHLELVRQAQKLADHVVVTIFVNPTQFAPGEDFDAYPRTLEADIDALSRVGADVVWAPNPREVYPDGTTVTIDPGPIASVLEGATRPTHFAGVALVCTKVVGIVQPDIALFGEKDAQQLAMLRAVFSQLDIPVQVRSVAIVRDDDGVALSSRNRYLSTDERRRARSLSRGLREGVNVANQGGSAQQIVASTLKELTDEDGVVVDYVALVDDGTFEVLAGSDTVTVIEHDAQTRMTQALGNGGRAGRILVAAKVGTTRLIDNMPVTLMNPVDWVSDHGSGLNEDELHYGGTTNRGDIR